MAALLGIGISIMTDHDTISKFRHGAGTSEEEPPGAEKFEGSSLAHLFVELLKLSFFCAI